MNMSNNQIEIICYVRKYKYFKSNTNSYVYFTMKWIES